MLDFSKVTEASNDVCFTGSRVEKPIGEAVLQVDTMLGKERKVNVRGDAQMFVTTAH